MTSLAGIGLRHPHVKDVLAIKPSVGWFEIHSENYMYDQGPRKQQLLAIRENYPISLHGVCLSLGSADGLDYEHLRALKQLIHQLNPSFVSDHLSWGRINNKYIPDLLPIPYTEESLAVFVDNLQKAQDFLEVPILIENPSSYILYPESTLTEPEFLKEVIRQTGGQILLDVNNVYVACHNHRWDSFDYINSFMSHEVGEIHLAGHSKSIEVEELLIDTHSTYVSPPVWDLYRYTLQRLGPKPTLIEWDMDLPDFSQLQAEALKAQRVLDEVKKSHETQAKAATIS